MIILACLPYTICALYLHFKCGINTTYSDQNRFSFHRKQKFGTPLQLPMSVFNV